MDLSAAAGDDGHPLPRFLVTGRSQEQPAPEWHPGHLGNSGPAAEDAPGTVPDSPGSTGEDGPDLLRPVGTGGATEHPMDLDAPSLQPVDAATGPAQEQSSANPGDEPFGDNDLERLEASLRWLQRAESTSRLPRAADLGPVQGVPPADAQGRRYSAGLVARRTNLPRSLEPERMAPPPLKSGGDKWRLAVYTLIASILVAAISYYLAAGGWTSQPQPQPAAGPRVASVEPMITRQPSPAVVAQEGETVSARDDEREAPAQEEPTPGPAVTQPVEQPAGREKMAMLQPAETVAQPPPPAAPRTPSKALRTLHPEQIKLLLKQGEQFIAAGDLVRPGWCCSAPRKRAMRPPRLLWVRPMTQVCWQSSASWEWAPRTSRKRGAGTKRRRASARPRQHDGSRFLRTGDHTAAIASISSRKLGLASPRRMQSVLPGGLPAK